MTENYAPIIIVQMSQEDKDSLDITIPDEKDVVNKSFPYDKLRTPIT